MKQTPQSRRTFRSAADELNYLNDKISYWWYQRAERAHALRFCNRFEKLLRGEGKENGSIVLQEHWGLLHEVRGNRDRAIAAREREIALTKRLLEMGGPVGPVDHEYLASTLVLLAGLHREAGQLSKAVQALREAETLSAGHSFPFAAAKMLDALLTEERAANRIPSRQRA